MSRRLNRARAANAQLRADNERLRAGLPASVTDPTLAALLAEVRRPCAPVPVWSPCFAPLMNALAVVNGLTAEQTAALQAFAPESGLGPVEAFAAFRSMLDESRTLQ